MYTVWIKRGNVELCVDSLVKMHHESLEEAMVRADQWNDTNKEFAYVKDDNGNRWTRENGNGKIIIW